jgi:hypothetical protein
MFQKSQDTESLNCMDKIFLNKVSRSGHTFRNSLKQSKVSLWLKWYHNYQLLSPPDFPFILSVYAFSILTLNQVNDFNEIWYGRYAIRDNPTLYFLISYNR